MRRLFFSTKRVGRREKSVSEQLYESNAGIAAAPCGGGGMRKINVGTASAERTRRAVREPPGSITNH